MKILITGGAGFVGTNLTEIFLNQGHQVICLDNFYTGSRANITKFLKNKNYRLVKQNVEKPFYFKIDQIYNLACPASPIHYQKDPVGTIRANVLGMINCLNLARKTGAKVLQASTSEIYGDPRAHPQKESYWGNVNPIGERSCYDEGKRVAETLCFEYWRAYKIPVKLVRIFNTYGPRMAADDGRVVSNFIIQALKNKNVTIYGDGSQTRSFQYIDDLIAGMLKFMETKDNFFGPLNLGNPVEFTVKELAKKVLAKTGSKSRIIYQALPPDDPVKRRPDISLAKEKLGWTPKIKLDLGLEKTIEYFRQII